VRSSPTPSLVAHVLGLLEPQGGVTARAMFGGHGFFREGVMFALCWGGTLFLRGDPRGLEAAEARGLRRFVYRDRCGRPVAMPYFEAPAEALADEAELTRLAEDALAAAREARARPRP
jgi:DNA transformation protein and related proteins